MGLFYMARTFRRKTGRKTRSNKKSTRRSRRKVGGMNWKLPAILALIAPLAAAWSPNNRATVTFEDGKTITGLIKTHKYEKGNDHTIWIEPDVANSLPQGAGKSTNKRYYLTKKKLCENGALSVQVDLHPDTHINNPELPPSFTYDVECDVK
jgi:hypothetical protein